MGAAIELAIRFHAVTDDAAPAVAADGCKPLYRALRKIAFESPANVAIDAGKNMFKNVLAPLVVAGLVAGSSFIDDGGKDPRRRYEKRRDCAQERKH
jgi:hypothetical protein